MKKFFAFALMVTIVGPFGQCSSFHRLPSDTGSVAWELKLDDGPYGGYQYSDTRSVAAAGYSQTFGKSYTPTSYYNSPKATYEKPAYGVVPEVAVTPGLVHKTHYQPSYHHDYHGLDQTHTVYNRPVTSTLRTPVYKTGNIHGKDYTGVHHFHGQNYGRYLTEGGHPHDYLHSTTSPQHFYHY